MAGEDFVVTGRRVVLPSGVRPASVHVVEGRIAAVAEIDEWDVDAVVGSGRVDADGHAAARVVDAGDLVVLPGFVDAHVHVNEPGRTEWEGFAHATAAAAAGGITTIVDMPLNCVPPTTSAAALEAKRAVAADRVSVDVAFWGGLVGENREQLEGLVEAGVCGCKAFVVDSGVDEFPAVGDDALAEGLRQLGALDVPTLVHAEDADVIADAAGGLASGPPRAYRTWLASRPPEAERRAVQRLIAHAEETGAPAHVVHVSAAEVLDDLAAARRRKVPITAETCPHYLTLAAEDVPDGATAYKCAPPIREAANAERLWAALGDGTLDMVVSDHSPSPPDRKALDTGDFTAAWGGIASLQLASAVVWTGARERGFGLADLSRWMSTAPAALAGLPGKGAITVGRDADLVLFDPDAKLTVRGADLQHRHPVTPYEGRTLTGVVRRTWVRGRQVYADGVVQHGNGRLLRREARE